MAASNLRVIASTHLCPKSTLGSPKSGLGSSGTSWATGISPRASRGGARVDEENKTDHSVPSATEQRTLLRGKGVEFRERVVTLLIAL